MTRLLKAVILSIATITLVLCTSVVCFARTQDIWLLNWNISGQVTIDNTITNLTVNQDTTTSEYRRVRFGAATGIVASGETKKYTLTYTAPTNSGVEVGDYNNTNATVRIEMEVYPQNGNNISGNYLANAAADSPNIIVHFANGNIVTGQGQAVSIEKLRYNSTSTYYYKIVTDYSFFIPKTETTIDGFTADNGINISIGQNVTANPTLRIYYNIYPLVVSTGGQALTGDDLEQALSIEGEKPDDSAIRQEEELTNELNEKIKDPNAIAEDMPDVINNSSGSLIQALAYNAQWLNVFEENTFTSYIVTYGTIFGILAILAGVATAIRTVY